MTEEALRRAQAAQDQLGADIEAGRLPEVIRGLLHIQARVVQALEAEGALSEEVLDLIFQADFARHTVGDQPRASTNVSRLFLALLAVCRSQAPPAP